MEKWPQGRVNSESGNDVEQTKEVSWSDYLKTRDYIDKDGNIHDAKTGQIKEEGITARDDFNRLIEELDAKKEGSRDDLGIVSLAKELARARKDRDKTRQGDIENEIKDRLISMEGEYGWNNEATSARLQQILKIAGDDDEAAKARSQQILKTVGEDDNETSTETEPTESGGSETSTETEPTESGEDPEGPTSTEGDGPEVLKVITIDGSVDVRQLAIDFANQRLTEELNSQAGFLKRWGRQIWKGNIAKDYYRARYAREAEEVLIEEGNFFGRDASPEQIAEARRTLFERYSLEYDEAIHESAGETKVDITDSEFATGGKDLIRRYVNHEIDREALEQELNNLIRGHARGENPVLPGADLIKVSNLMEVADCILGSEKHRESLEETLENMRFYAGEARTGVRTAMRETTTDRLYEKMSQSKNGIFCAAKPETILVASGVAGMIVGFGGKRAAATALSIVPGAGGAVIAGWREGKRTEEDRIQHSREMAQGGAIDDGSRRRREMEEARYETSRAQDLTDELNDLTAKLSAGEVDVNRALNGLASINARISLGDKRGIDLISFDSQSTIGTERLELDIARAELRVQIDNTLDGLSPEERQALGLGEGSALDLANRRSQEAVNVIEADITEKDKVFRKLKAKRVAKSAAIGAGVGSTLGLLVGQEVFASLADNRQGLLEGAWGGRNDNVADTLVNRGKVHNTLLESWVHGDADRLIPSSGNAELVDHSLDDSGSITTPKGMSVNPVGDGVYSLSDANGSVIVNNVTFNSAGEMDERSFDALREANYDVQSNPKKVEVYDSSQEVPTPYSNAGNYIKDNGGVEISARTWADNDTATPDRNELRGWEMGVGEDGTIHYSVQHMTEDGSYGQGPSVNWRDEATAGNMSVFISGTIDTQNYAFEIPVGADGSIEIPPDHPAQQFFNVEPGQDWKAGDNFNGAFMEVAVKEPQSDGSVAIHCLATEEGRNSPGEIVGTTQGAPVETMIPHVTITPPTEVVTDMTPSIPVVGRKSMEELRRPGRRLGLEGEDTSQIEGPVAGQDLFEKERSPRLLENPQVALKPKEELQWFNDQLETANPERVAGIKELIEKDEVLSNLPRNLKGIVTIPVSSMHESDNISKVLEHYIQGDNKDLDKTVFLLNLNYTEGALDDLQRAAQTQKTKDEIQQIRNNHPQLKVSVLSHTYSPGESQEAGGVIGYTAKDMYDTALLAIENATSKDALDSPENIVIIRNGADTTKMSKNYLDKIYKSVDENPETDIFQGATRHGLGTAQKWPGFSVLTNFDAALRSLEARRGNADTDNHNFAVRASTMAAVGGVGTSDAPDTEAFNDDARISDRIRVARGSNNKFSRAVYGAQIESNPDKVLETYLRNNGDISTAWDDFPIRQEGYDARELDDIKQTPESAQESVDRIENGINSVIRNNNVNEKDLRRVAMVFFGLGANGNNYKISKDRQGELRFEITKAGRRNLINQLVRRADKPSYYAEHVARVGSRMV